MFLPVKITVPFFASPTHTCFRWLHGLGKVCRSYLEWLTALPWGKYSEDRQSDPMGRVRMSILLMWISSILFLSFLAQFKHLRS